MLTWSSAQSRNTTSGVRSVAQWLQRQSVGVLHPVDRTLDASKEVRLVRDCACPRASLLTARRYGSRPVGIHWISHTVMLTQQHCISRLSRELPISGVLRGERVCSVDCTRS